MLQKGETKITNDKTSQRNLKKKQSDKEEYKIKSITPDVTWAVDPKQTAKQSNPVHKTCTKYYKE